MHIKIQTRQFSGGICFNVTHYPGIFMMLVMHIITQGNYSANLILHSKHSSSEIYTRKGTTDLFASACRLFHEGFSPIYGAP